MKHFKVSLRHDPRYINIPYLPHRIIRVVLKGGDEHYMPIGRKPAAALDRYLRARARHPHPAQVIVQIDVRLLQPHRVVQLQRDVDEPVAQRLQQVQPPS